MRLKNITTKQFLSNKLLIRKYGLYADIDLDGVPNVIDCFPFDKKRHLYIGARDLEQREKEAAAKIEYAFRPGAGISEEEKRRLAEEAAAAAGPNANAQRISSMANQQAQPTQSYGSTTYIPARNTKEGFEPQQKIVTPGTYISSNVVPVKENGNTVWKIDDTPEGNYQVSYKGAVYPTSNPRFIPKAYKEELARQEALNVPSKRERVLAVLEKQKTPYKLNNIGEINLGNKKIVLSEDIGISAIVPSSATVDTKFLQRLPAQRVQNLARIQRQAQEGAAMTAAEGNYAPAKDEGQLTTRQQMMMKYVPPDLLEGLGGIDFLESRPSNMYGFYKWTPSSIDMYSEDLWVLEHELAHHLNKKQGVSLGESKQHGVKFQDALKEVELEVANYIDRPRDRIELFSEKAQKAFGLSQQGETFWINEDNALNSYVVENRYELPKKAKLVSIKSKVNVPLLTGYGSIDLETQSLKSSKQLIKYNELGQSEEDRSYIFLGGNDIMGYIYHPYPPGYNTSTIGRFDILDDNSSGLRNISISTEKTSSKVGEKGFFKEYGIDLAKKLYDIGKSSVKGFAEVSYYGSKKIKESNRIPDYLKDITPEPIPYRLQPRNQQEAEFFEPTLALRKFNIKELTASPNVKTLEMVGSLALANEIPIVSKAIKWGFRGLFIKGVIDFPKNPTAERAADTTLYALPDILKLSGKVLPKPALRTLELPQKAPKEPVKIKLLGLETSGGRALTLGSKSPEGIGIGTPSVKSYLKNVPKSADLKVGSALETKALQKTLKDLSAETDIKVTPRAAGLIPLTQDILRETLFTKSKYKRALPETTQRLGKEGVKVVYDIGKEYEGVLFGSTSRQAQLAKTYLKDSKIFELIKEPRDIEIRFDNAGPEMLQKITDVTISKLRKKGINAREISDTPYAIEAKVKGTYEKIIEYKGSEEVIELDPVPEYVAGIRKAGKPTKIQKLKVTTLAEELRGVSQGVLRIRNYGDTIDIFPVPKRMKDIGSVSVSARTLLESKLIGKARLKANIEKFEGYFPKELVEEQIRKVEEARTKELLADFSASSKKSFQKERSMYGMTRPPYSEISSARRSQVSPRSELYSNIPSASRSISPSRSFSRSYSASRSISPSRSASSSKSISNSISKSISRSASESRSTSKSLSKSFSPSPSKSISRSLSRSVSRSSSYTSIPKNIIPRYLYSIPKNQIRRISKKKRRFAENLIYIPDFTSRELGLKVKISRRKLENQIRDITFSGFESRKIPVIS